MIDVDADVLLCSSVGDDEVVTMTAMMVTMIVMVVTATCQRRREAKLNVLHENLLKDLKIHFRQILLCRNTICHQLDKCQAHLSSLYLRELHFLF